jgi:hypothetical protein
MTPGATTDTEAVAVGADLARVEESLVWVLGSPRTGSSWLMRLLKHGPGIVGIWESLLPDHLVPVAAARDGGEFFQHHSRADDPNYFFARRYLPDLRSDLRGLALRQIQRLAREAPGADSSREPDWIVIKEPGGSHGADTLFWLLPRGRLLFLLRDGRDVVDSHADAILGKESWWGDREHLRANSRAPSADDRRSFITRNARRWVIRTNACLRAFEALPDDRRLIVRYEDLVAETATELGSIFGWLGVDVPASQVEAIVSRYAFESIDPSKRGPGKIFRAATPGLWRESFDEGEQQLLWEVMGDTLTRLGYER